MKTLPFYTVLATFSLGLIIVVFGAAFWHAFAFPDSSHRLDKGERVTLESGERLTQPFIASRNGLKRIEVLYGSFELKESDQLVVELRDQNCSEILASKIYTLQPFDSEYTRNVNFSKIEDSQNQTYCLAFTFTTSRDIEKRKGPRLYTDTSVSGTPYTITSQTTTETDRGEGVLAFRPGYANNSLFANTHELFNRISQYKPFFLKTPFLLPIALLGLVLTLLTTFLLLREEK